MSLRVKLAALGAVAALGCGLGVSASPASADAAGGVVHGVGEWEDDWHDEGPVSASSYAHSNVTAMWQAILWADKSYEPDGTPMEMSDIDCRFGPDTTYTTKRWQSRYDWMNADGIVGELTLRMAMVQLRESGGSTYTYYGQTHTGESTGRYITFYRADNGRWGMYIGNDLRTLWYKDATFNQCT